MLIYDVLWCINILLSGFILLLFSRICWKIRISRLGGADLELVRNTWIRLENMLRV